MDLLRLVALDADDLNVISAHLQDAIVRVGDLVYEPKGRRFALVGRRFDWEAPPDEPRRRLTGLHFNRVLGARLRGIRRDNPDALLTLLAVTFEETEAPSGRATLIFAEGAIQLDLECVEAQITDLGPVWGAGSRPRHDLEGEAAGTLASA